MNDVEPTVHVQYSLQVDAAHLISGQLVLELLDLRLNVVHNALGGVHCLDHVLQRFAYNGKNLEYVCTKYCATVHVYEGSIKYLESFLFVSQTHVAGSTKSALRGHVADSAENSRPAGAGVPAAYHPWAMRCMCSKARRLGKQRSISDKFFSRIIQYL